MFKELDFDPKVVDQHLFMKDHEALMLYLDYVFKMEKGEDGSYLKIEYSEEAIHSLHVILMNIATEYLSHERYGLAKSTFRSLRNYVMNPQVQDSIITAKFLECVKTIILNVRELGLDKVCQQILQFLNNLTVKNTTAALSVFAEFSFVIFDLLNEHLLVHETSAFLYTMTFHKSLDNLDSSVYNSVIELYLLGEQSEYLHFLLEKFLSYVALWQLYKDLPIDSRLLILELLRDKQISEKTVSLPGIALEILTEQFVTSGSIIFQTATSNDPSLEVNEVSLVLEIISALCSDEEYQKTLQTNKDLLINTGITLINIQRLGKESDNYFSSIQKLSELREPNSSITEHPAFGFKVGLVRIIANLCWKNTTMQNLVREAELIPLLLDCCNMDARNPLIMQWVILAVRNLCENNPKNQAVIAGMHQQGTVSSATLLEMGLTLQSGGEKGIQIVPLEALKTEQ